ncbi:voltage-gated chloride channel family protein [soil metagenome]
MSRSSTSGSLKAQVAALSAAAGVGALCGAASAAFLFLLELATKTRTTHEWLVYALPLAGVVIGLAYERLGSTVVRGNDLVIDTVHAGGPTIPARMAPMVFFFTLVTHLFGGSAGREGTAVQMGASLADTLARRLSVSAEVRSAMLVAGVAGGFGSVFGTPLAGAIFALELVVKGRIATTRLAPALVAAFVGDAVTRKLGIVHTPYPTIATQSLDLALSAKWALFAIAIAITAIAFIEGTHRLKAFLAERITRLPLRAALGGVAVVVLWKLASTSDYLGLGVPGIVAAFHAPTPPWVFFSKLVFTVVTLGAGFVGGEVTPLFFIGATLGATLAPALGIPQPLAAAVGLAAMFGVAANTPIALSIMAVELFGSGVLPHVVLVVVLAWVLAGRRSIYRAQRSADVSSDREEAAAASSRRSRKTRDRGA